MMFTNIMKALSTSPISLGQPWLIDLSHLLLVISASCNVVIYTAQVGNQIMYFLGLLGVRLFCVNLRNVTEFASNLNLTHTGTIHTAHTAELLSMMMFMKRCTQDVRFRNLLVSDLKRLLLLYRKKTDRLCFYQILYLVYIRREICFRIDFWATQPFIGPRVGFLQQKNL